MRPASREGGPVTLARFLDTGFCVGLLDPVSNIMINTVATSVLRPDFKAKVLTFTGAVVEEKLAEMGRRSLDGLVAFLIYFFPYLVGWEALRYLLVADADLLVAARLIVADRSMMMFSLTSPASSPAFEAALRLAAQVAKHPQPNRLVHVWMSLSSRLHKVLMVVQPYYPSRKLRHLNRFLDEPVVPYLGQSWDLAASRLPHKSITSMPYQQFNTRDLSGWCFLTQFAASTCGRWPGCRVTSSALATTAVCSKLATATAPWIPSPTSSSIPSGMMSHSQQLYSRCST